MVNIGKIKKLFVKKIFAADGLKKLVKVLVILVEKGYRLLSSLSVEHRRIFMQRYWYMCSIKEIAEDNSMTQSNVKMTLLRLRNTLREKLKREGVEI